LFFFFFNDTATTEIYTLSLHDALPISDNRSDRPDWAMHTNNTLDLRPFFIERGSTVRVRQRA